MLEQCRSLEHAEPHDPASGKSGSPLIGGFKSELKCECCGRALVSLLQWSEIESSPLEMAELPAHFNALCCLYCVMQGGESFARAHPSGAVEWHKVVDGTTEDAGEGHLKNLQLRPLRFGDERPPRHSFQEFFPVCHSQIGGFPTWIQDASFPSCVECRKTMSFVGQVSAPALGYYDEGIFYSFWCEACRLSATSFQMG